MPRKRVAPKRKVKKQNNEDVACGDASEHAPGLSKQEKQQRLEAFLIDFQQEFEERQTWLREQYEEQMRAVSMLFDLEIARYPEHILKIKITDFLAQLEKNTSEEKHKIPTNTVETAEEEENKENMIKIGQKRTKKQTAAAGGSWSLAADITTPAPPSLADLISLLNMAAQQRNRMDSLAEIEEGNPEEDLPPLSETDLEKLRNHLDRCNDTLGAWVAKSTQARKHTRKLRQ